MKWLSSIPTFAYLICSQCNSLITEMYQLSVDFVLMTLVITQISPLSGSCSNQDFIKCDDTGESCKDYLPETNDSLSYRFDLSTFERDDKLFINIKPQLEEAVCPQCYEMLRQTTSYEVKLSLAREGVVYYNGWNSHYPVKACYWYKIEFNDTLLNGANTTDIQFQFLVSKLSNLEENSKYLIAVRSLPQSLQTRQNQYNTQYNEIFYATPTQISQMEKYFDVTYKTGISSIDITFKSPWVDQQWNDTSYCNVQLSNPDSSIHSVKIIRNVDNKLTESNITKEYERVDGYVKVEFRRLVPAVSYKIKLTVYALESDGKITGNAIRKINISIKAPSYADQINNTDIQIAQHNTDGVIIVKLPVPPNSYLLSKDYNLTITDVRNNRTVFTDRRQPQNLQPDEKREDWMIGVFNLGPNNIKNGLQPSTVYRLMIQPFGLSKLCKANPGFCNMGTHCIPCEKIIKDFEISEWGGPTDNILVITVCVVAVLIIISMIGLMIYFRHRHKHQQRSLSDNTSYKSVVTWDATTVTNKQFQMETNIAFVITAAQNTAEWFICEKLSEILLTIYKEDVKIYDEDNIRKILETNPRNVVIPLTRDLVQLDTNQDGYKYGNLLTQLKNKDLLKLLRTSEYPKMFPRQSPQDVPIPLFVKLPYQSVPEQLTQDTDGRSLIYNVPGQFNEMMCFIGGDPQRLREHRNKISVLETEMNDLLNNLSEGIDKERLFYSNQPYSTDGQSLLTDLDGVALLSEPDRSDSGHGPSIQELSISEMLSDFSEFTHSEELSKNSHEQ